MLLNRKLHATKENELLLAYGCDNKSCQEKQSLFLCLSDSTDIQMCALADTCFFQIDALETHLIVVRNAENWYIILSVKTYMEYVTFVVQHQIIIYNHAYLRLMKIHR